MTIQEQVPYREISWFNTGGVIEYYSVCKTLAEIIAATTRAQALGVPYMVLGDGSNVLMSDSGYPGLIIHNKSQGMVFLHDRSQVMVEAGLPVSRLLTHTLSHGYSGLEFLAGIPGTVGGAVYSNACAFGYQMSEYVKSATLLFPRGGSSEDRIRRVDRDWFAFSSTVNRLKEADEVGQSKPVILSVTLQLSKMSPAICLSRANTYARLRRLTDPNGTLPSLRAFDSLRITGVRDPIDQAMGRKQDTVPFHYCSRRVLRHWRQGDVSVARDNPNYIINTKMATSRDAAALIAGIQESVASEEHPLPVRLEYIGLWD